MTIPKSVSINAIIPSQLKNFTCGIIELDDYLKRYAKNNEKKWISRTFLLLNESQGVIGYYTLNAAQIDYNLLPDSHKKGLPHYPVPASRLCRLAVDISYQGKRLGEHLLMDAISRVLVAAEQTAIYLLLVDAKNERAKNFYLKYGFLSLPHQNMTLFLPIATLKKQSYPDT